MVAGLADATIGWAISSAIGPYISVGHHQLTLLSIFIVIVIVTIHGAFFGFLGALVRLPFSTRQNPA
jgi:hypothetical protein